MPDLHTDILLPTTLAVFDVLSRAKELSGITLLGGTALSLQIGHRVSLDLDFAVFDPQLPGRLIDDLISRLKAEGEFEVNEIVDQMQASTFKINTGNSIRDFSRDYVINGTKVTFFTHGKSSLQKTFYRNATKVKLDGMQFDILGIEGLKASKVLVLADRATSRDLYDLMFLMRDYEFTMAQAESIVKDIGHIDDFEHYRAIMTGLVPLDNRDPGLSPVGVDVNIDDIYAFFESQFEAFDIEQASNLFSRDPT